MGSVNSLDGRVAIVTGASRGIGEAIARALVAEGARVVISARKGEALSAVAESLGDRAHAVVAHAGKQADCASLVGRAIEHFGKVDMLINNAATNPYLGPFVDVDEPAWDKTFEVNVKGYFWLARNVSKHLRERRAPGSIVNITSIAGLRASPLQGVYGMTKAAVISMTQTLATELAGENIRVNAIAPGLVATRLSKAIVENEAVADLFVQRTPMRRYGYPEEIAGAAVYLASDASSFMTGQTLVIDGGLTVTCA